LCEQFGAGQSAVAVLGGFEQDVLQAGASAMRRIPGNAELVPESGVKIAVSDLDRL
jgi:hypothetical protein